MHAIESRIFKFCPPAGLTALPMRELTFLHQKAQWPDAEAL